MARKLVSVVRRVLCSICQLPRRQSKMLTTKDARGDSPALDAKGYATHAKRGEAIYNDVLNSRVDPASEDYAWKSVQEPWGGVTFDQWQGAVTFDSGYAVSIAGPGNQNGTLALDLDTLTEDAFRQTYREAVRRFAFAPYFGIFRDEDTGRIEFDPVAIVKTEDDARDLATYCEATGGAYDFATGNGVFPYHVKAEAPNGKCHGHAPWLKRELQDTGERWNVSVPSDISDDPIVGDAPTNPASVF